MFVPIDGTIGIRNDSVNKFMNPMMNYINGQQQRKHESLNQGL